MAVKEWFQKLRPVQLYIVLIFTAVFFAIELIISHITHSLTLLVDSYHMLCNMIALVGCIISIKKLHPEDQECGKEISNKSEDEKSIEVQKAEKLISESESSLKNTFGWARIDLLVMLIGCIFLASLCFSVLIEAVQTLIHIDHMDEMHFPLVILTVGAGGLLLVGFSYSLIGGYTLHQGSYLHVTESGEVILERSVAIDSLRKVQKRSTASAEPETASSQSTIQRQGIREMIRDIIGCVYVIICALVVYFTSGLQVAKFLDPIISIISVISLLLLSYPYMKESGLILLQTIPDDINIDSLRQQLLQAFPDIINVHDLHVWQLTVDKTISTAHVILVDPTDYLRINKEIIKFFTDQGITKVTIQAEFLPQSERNRKSLEILRQSLSAPCLMPCMTEECIKRHCCAREEETKNEENLEVIKILGDGAAVVINTQTNSGENP